MMHGVISNNSIPSIGYVLNASTKGKLALPVEPTAMIYSHFKHVSGVPAPEGSRGVAISKLNILDILIEQVSQIKRAGDAAISAQVPEFRLDSMIETYKTQFREAKEAHAAIPYIPAPQPQAGLLFSFTI